MGCQIRRILSWLLLLGAVCLLLLGMASQPATAAISSLEEAPNQMVYQSRQTLRDQQGNYWQTIAFKRIRPDGQAHFYLRLVGFPGVADLDRTQPLTIIPSLGTPFTAADASSQFVTDAANAVSNVGQYDLEPILLQLQAEVPLKLMLATTDHSAVILQVPPTLVQEWQALENTESPSSFIPN